MLPYPWQRKQNKWYASQMLCAVWQRGQSHTTTAHVLMEAMNDARCKPSLIDIDTSLFSLRDVTCTLRLLTSAYAISCVLCGCKQPAFPPTENPEGSGSGSSSGRRRRKKKKSGGTRTCVNGVSTSGDSGDCDLEVNLVTKIDISPQAFANLRK